MFKHSRISTTSGSEAPKRPSRAHLSIFATLCTTILVAGGVFTPHKNDTALAADTTPQEPFTFLANTDSTSPSQGLARMDLDQLETQGRPSVEPGIVYPLPELPRVDISRAENGEITLSQRPKFEGQLGYKYAAVTDKKNLVFYTIDPELQGLAEQLVKNAQANHVAIVAMNPRTGAVLAIAGKSYTMRDIEYHSGFPAASLFKVVTAAAAVEEAGLNPDSIVAFRGGTYTLNQANYMPDSRKDRRLMSISEAMGRSCNPVFGHIGLRYLNAPILSKFAYRFGFNQSLTFEAPLEKSTALIPHDSSYELSRTAAGFGQVTISPVHAAAMVSGVANGGLLPKPFIVEKITAADGAVLQRAETTALQRMVTTNTSQSLLEMMHHTTTIGTSRREFMRGSRPTLGNIEVAAKTGTLTGTNPKGLNNWFIAAAPISNPQLALAVITVDARRSSKASYLGRRMFEKYFNVTASEPAPRITRTTRAPKKQPSTKRFRSGKATKRTNTKGKSSR